MKKQITFLLIGLGLVAFSSLSFAESQLGKGIRTVEGTIVSVNTSKDVAVIKDNAVAHYYTVRVFPDQIGSIQAGENVTAVSYGNGPLTLK
ncbi:MAG: hypothetical protein KGJ09_02975 [Candidatus Omnitrophica bacterium]|nr:hypothetical protein [Candidatus Omnitrophota bacterium]MDE2009024.1 hypothetical protein [Candidatus Omnitrophota bacterium]MDE2214548.1 hypothetical protein [Candidatus Omnitrophota bacterium]MDE2230866.1 hypothetical protein [Candidatus Omnitrophota bacterium]